MQHLSKDRKLPPPPVLSPNCNVKERRVIRLTPGMSSGMSYNSHEILIKYDLFVANKWREQFHPKLKTLFFSLSSSPHPIVGTDPQIFFFTFLPVCHEFKLTQTIVTELMIWHQWRVATWRD